MSPTKIPRESIFGTWRQFMMPLCSICPDGPPPSSEKQPKSFHLAPQGPPWAFPLLLWPHLLSFSHSFCSRRTGLTSGPLYMLLLLILDHLVLHSPPTSYLTWLFCLSPSHSPALTLFVMTNRIGLTQLEWKYHVGRDFPVPITTASLVLSPQPDT